MKKLIQKLVASGADLSTKKTLKAALNLIGADPENIDKIYIDVKNSLHREEFKKIDPKDKILFLPQCLRNPSKCKAPLTEYGYACKRCGSCKVAEITKEAEKRGYRVFVVPGGSMVFRIVNEHRPKAILGVACMKELISAAEEIKIPIQAVELSRDGCVNTDVDVKKIFDALDGHEEEEE